MKNVIKMMFLAVVLTGVAVNVSAQEEETVFTYGQVVKVAEDSVTLSEYDFETETTKEAVYYLSERTVFENVGSLSDILVGDEVEIEYETVEEKRMALNVYKDTGEDVYDPNQAEGMGEMDIEGQEVGEIDMPMQEGEDKN